MSRKIKTRDVLSLGLMATAILLLMLSLAFRGRHADAGAAATSLSRKLTKRVELLDSYMGEALSYDKDKWLSFSKFPEDMVVYRYVDDTLQSWCRQFPIRNDDISLRYPVQRLANFRGTIVSPLLGAGPELSYVNYGPKWYLVHSMEKDNVLVIGGLEVVNELGEGSFNGVNSRLSLDEGFSIEPLSGGIGVPVNVAGKTLMKVSSAVSGVQQGANPLLLLMAVVMYICGCLLLLSGGRNLPRFIVTIGLIGLITAWLCYYGRATRTTMQMFSPVLYADGAFFYSLGTVLSVNLFILLVVVCVYMVRWPLLRWMRGGKARVFLALAATVVAFAGIAVYLHLMFRSVVMNSSISLVLFRPQSLSWYTAIVYLSFLSLSLSFPLLVQLSAAPLRHLAGIRIDAFSLWGRVLYAVVVAIYFVTASSLLGFRKEQNRVDVWGNRLSMDRDIGLEIQLRSIEGALASDPVISALAPLDNSNVLIQNRLTDSYMGRIVQNNDVSVMLLDEGRSNPMLEAMFSVRISGGTQISDGSHFFYSRDDNGRARYAGLFTYYSPQNGVANMMLTVDPKSNREDRGYLNLLGIIEPGRVALPSEYSYAKYVSDKLISFKGAYAYPTYVSERIRHQVDGHDGGHLNSGGYTHFVHRVSDDELIIISRPSTGYFKYMVEWLLFALLAFGFISLVAVGRRRRGAGQKSYYRNRINAVMYTSLLLTLVGMAVFSVYFVYRNNEADMKTIMSSKINSIQTMVQARCRMASSYRDLLTQDISTSLDNTGNTLKSDISLYTPSGQAFMTTTPEVFDRMIVGHRINEDAFYNIVYAHKRYYIHKEKLSSRTFYSLYAPIFNNDGVMTAIISSPYTDRNYDLENEAVTHVATIIAVFFLLLLVARVLSSAVVERLFKPLSEMSRKMKVSDVDHLEYIVYDRADEISSLVAAYNLMVHDLSDSTRALAQAERDKAWSAMARQVAHEIKNPLTPIKLKLQMLIRMKNSGNPAWEEKFDEVAGVVLDHIDVLADTANEFSTFAKLYSEEPVLIDLDSLIRDEVMMFEGREGLDISYIGLSGAEVMGPKPQLTRVMVNLITNAVQAVDETPDAKVVVSLRNSVKEGCFDIVVEDNGPGVSEENMGKLFTPNFTTKSTGTGLGLAICHSIIERCNGEILYSRSFTLGGACFTVRYPKKT